MNTSNPYVRTFIVSTIWYAAIFVKLWLRHSGSGNAMQPSLILILAIGWLVTSLLIGVISANFARFRSWPSIVVGTILGSLVVFGSMLLVVERIYAPPPAPKFKSTGELMAYMANEATQWVKKDRNITLDYSVDSIKIVEEELGRISKEVDKKNPQPGTFGTASAYGAYVGEVIRRQNGGTWAVDHPQGGERSFPLTISSNRVLFPVGWCWKRLINGEEDNVYFKAVIGLKTIPEKNGN